MNALKNTGAAVFGAAAIALAIGGFAQPTVALAEKVWDIGEFDSCSKKAEDRFIAGKTNSAQFADEIKFCCQMSGGEWTSAQGCTAPPATFQTQPQIARLRPGPPTGHGHPELSAAISG